MCIAKTMSCFSFLISNLAFVFFYSNFQRGLFRVLAASERAPHFHPRQVRDRLTNIRNNHCEHRPFRRNYPRCRKPLDQRISVWRTTFLTIWETNK
jgi:hypothetical protein